MRNLEIKSHGGFTYIDSLSNAHGANFPLYLIKKAWERGCGEFEELADGFGKGHGTMGGDWSGIRDSSDKSMSAMLARALVFLGLED